MSGIKPEADVMWIKQKKGSVLYDKNQEGQGS